MRLSRYLTSRIITGTLINFFFMFSIHCFAENTLDQHRDFSQLLRSHVDNGVVDYKGFADNPSFNAYLDYIANQNFTEENSSSEKLAFYINAYNALAIKGIIDGSSPKRFFGKITYFYRDKYVIANEKMNLYDLEHKIIRPFNEPRIHFALVCASTSCPKLRTESYTAENLDRQLTESALSFINDKSKNDFDLNNNRAKISKIFSWFEEDFNRTTSVQEFIAQYINDEEIKSVLKKNGFEIKYKKYDWSLNGTL